MLDLLKSLCYSIKAVIDTDYINYVIEDKKERRNMREGIHPDYKECKVTCACGNSFVTKSTKEEMRLDVCSACHPFFTGQQKFINRGGRVEKFKNKYNI